MVGKDRTQEFEALVRSLSKARPQLDRKGCESFRVRNEKTRFLIEAQLILNSLNDVTAKLKVLTAMAKKPSALFEQDKLYHSISLLKNNLTRLSSQMEGLAAIKDSRNKQMETHNENVILTLRLKLAERTNELQSVIQTTEKAGRRQQELEKYYEYRPNNQASQLLNADSGREETTSDSSLAIQMPAVTTQQRTNGAFNYEESRLNAVQQVQRGVSDLGELMVKLIVLLSEHQELLDRIEVNTVETEKRLVDAESQLLHFLASVRSSRSLKIKLFLILFFFILFFTLLL